MGAPAMGKASTLLPDSESVDRTGRETTLRPGMWTISTSIARIFGQFNFRRWLVRFILDRRRTLAVCFEKLLELDVVTVCNNERVAKPVGRPDPEDRPAKTLQHGLPNLVPVAEQSRRSGTLPRHTRCRRGSCLRSPGGRRRDPRGNRIPQLESEPPSPLARSASATAPSKGFSAGRVNPRRAKGGQSSRARHSQEMPSDPLPRQRGHG